MRVEPPGANGCLERPEVNVEFAGQLVKRQHPVQSCVIRDRGSSPLEHLCGYGSSPAIPRSKGFRRDTQQRGKFSLSESGRVAQIAQFVHVGHTMPFAAAIAKRPPACVAGDQRHFRRGAAILENARFEKCSAKSSIANLRRCGANSRDRSLFSMKLRL
jgi:hypothetical protein